LNLADDFFAITAYRAHRGVDAPRAHRIKRIESQLFEFNAYIVHA